MSAWENTIEVSDDPSEWPEVSADSPCCCCGKRGGCRAIEGKAACLTTSTGKCRWRVGCDEKLYHIYDIDPLTRKPYQPMEESVRAFLKCLFEPEDLILIRPIETWTEQSQKASKVDYKGTVYYPLTRLIQSSISWFGICREATKTKSNLFFGVCPRFGAKQFDLAWQIRTVRTLWADLDNCLVEEAIQRCKDANLLDPSIIVSSGHGVHLYWLLDENYLIDDVEDPLPVQTEFIDRGRDKKKEVRKYVVDPKTKQQTEKFPNLSPKAVHLQTILSGMAHKIGGDHTQDLSRLLRLPGTWNRKNQRNGQEPVLCTVIECHPGRRYSLKTFERFGERSPEKIKANQIERIRLPKGKRLTPNRANKLNQLINAIQLAPVGSRSELDFGLCAWAVKLGLDPEVIWNEVQNVGKFAERGREYFDRTWQSAQTKTRERIAYQYAAQPTSNDNRREEDEPRSSNNSTDESSEENLLESIDDPHRLGRRWLHQYADHVDGPTIRFYYGEFWRWKDHRWQKVSDDDLRGGLTSFSKQEIDREFATLQEWDISGELEKPPPITRTLISNVMQAIGGDVLLDSNFPMPGWIGEEGYEPRQYIALENGLLNIEALLNGEPEVLFPHSPRWFSSIRLPYPFDANAQCPQWLAILEKNLGSDQAKIRLLKQWAGYLLIPDTSQQKFLMLAGEGSNGKSVICTVLRAMLGDGNVSSVSLELFGQRFQLMDTLGKLANIVPEVGELDRIAEGQIKGFVSGDAMLFEQKFKAPFMAVPTARLVLATNNPPQFSDRSDGIWRRLVLLRFTVQIPAHERIPGLDKVEYWQNSGELPGILNWALSGLIDLRQTGRFVVPDDCQKDVEQLRNESNSARRFLTENYRTGYGEIRCNELYGKYSEWCVNSGHRPQSDTSFGREVHRLFPTVARRRFGPRGERYYVYLGIEKRED